MADDEGAGEDSCFQFTGAACDDARDTDTGNCRKGPSDDAELDDILDGTWRLLEITSRACRLTSRLMDSAPGVISNFVTHVTMTSWEKYGTFTIDSCKRHSYLVAQIWDIKPNQQRSRD